MKQRSRGRDYVASPPRQQPVNFGTVVANRVYRSGTPVMENCSYLTKTLGVRTVIYMCPGSYDAAMFKFLKDKNIAFVQYPIAGKTDPSVDPTGSVIGALKVIADERNHPVLIHCQGGKHRTGCVVGGLRKLQQWNIEKVLEEYEMYAGATPLENDVEFLRTFDVSGICTSLGPKIKAW